MRKTRLTALAFLCGLSLLTGCGGAAADSANAGGYTSISAEEAKQLMDSETGCVILDVRTEDEFAQGHIPGAVLLPYDEVPSRAEDLLPDKAQLILVYCRSGNRSKKASASLVELGYTNVREFGGIQDWPYEVEGVPPDGEG